MPMESVLVVAGVLVAFSLFAAALAWVDFTTPQTHDWSRTPAE